MEYTSKTVQQLYRSGRIRPSSSPWSSPVVLVPKHDGEPRMCIDYRKLNAQTKKDAYPIPLIDDCLRMCKDANWLSLIDVKDAFHHIPMDEASIPLTAFVTPDGLFEWLRMPFGLTNAPATFQRYIDHTLRPIIGKKCAAFFDDVLVYTKGPFHDHIKDVEEVLTLLYNAGLSAKISKCKFAFQEVVFVGHLIKNGTILPNPETLKAVADFPVPTSVTQVKSFLGLANYYRRFIKGFAQIASPLYQLLKKDPDKKKINKKTTKEHRKEMNSADRPVYSPTSPAPFEDEQESKKKSTEVKQSFHEFKRQYEKGPTLESVRKPFVWTAMAQNAYEALKQALCSAPCLHSPDFKKPFILQTDASAQGIAAVLAQTGDDGEEHPIGYVSRQLNEAEANYSATEWECLAVVWGIQQFSPFLQDDEFTVVTDHSALQWLPTKKFTNTRLMRWSLALNDYKFKVEHRKGSANANADALSRCPVSNSAPPIAIVASLLTHPRRHTAFQLAFGSQQNQLRCNHCDEDDLKNKYPHVATLRLCSLESTRKRKEPPSAQDKPSSKKIIDNPNLYQLYDMDNREVYQEIVNAQHTFPPYKAIIDYLISDRKRYPAGYTPIDKRKLLTQAEDFWLDMSSTPPALVHTAKAVRTPLAQLVNEFSRLAIPPQYRVPLLELFHSSPYGGHTGMTRTYYRLSMHYYWEGMNKDVQAWVDNCTSCQKMKSIHSKLEIERGHLPAPTSPWDLISMDFIGPLNQPLTNNRYRYILVIMDHFTRWCVAVPTEDQTSEIAAEILRTHIIGQFGPPRRLLTDKGSPFENAFFKSYCERHNIHKLRTTSYHPQCNGLVERTNGTLKESLAAFAYSDDFKNTWSSQLPHAVYAYNTSPSELLGISPYAALFARQPRLPFEPDMQRSRAEDYNSPSDAADFLFYKAVNIDNMIRGLLNSRLIKAAEANKQLQRIPTYQVNDLIYLRTPPNIPRLHDSPFPIKHQGPYIVTKVLSPINYLVQDTRRQYSQPEVVHVQRMSRASSDLNPSSTPAPPPISFNQPPASSPVTSSTLQSRALLPQPTPPRSSDPSSSSLPPDVKPINHQSQRYQLRDSASEYRPNYNESFLFPSTRSQQR